MIRQRQTKKEILVFADWVGLGGPTPVGVLCATQLRGKEVFEFEYDADWLKTNAVLLLDPDLVHFQGRQYPPLDKSNFGLYLDSMPDRWGKQLMQRREAVLARIDGRPPKHFLESDFLLGVYDLQRIGGLRFKFAGIPDFLNADHQLAAPPWTRLRDLERACWELENETWNNDQDQLEWLNVLLAPGSSLGGARPKAGVTDQLDRLWIAKFPSQTDTFNVGAWEMVLNKLGRDAGLNMAEGQLLKLGNANHTFLSRRFDRTTSKQRIHFASAMTLLQRKDGDDYSSGASYLELVAFIMRHGADPLKDLEELWRRIVFSILVRNTDDHLRNHGFILTEHGWILSPAFDVNPNPFGYGLKLNISENDNSLDTELALSVSGHFRLKPDKAKSILNNIAKAVARWKTVAETFGLDKNQIQFMERCFQPTTNTQ